MQLKLILCDHVSNVRHCGNATGHPEAMRGPSQMTSGDSKCKKGVQGNPGVVQQVTLWRTSDPALGT